MRRIGQVLGLAWLCALGVALLLSALVTDRRSQQTDEYAYGCDSFGYLQSAQDIRQATAATEWPRFNLETPDTRFLVDSMQSRKIPLELWYEVIAPHAYHYYPKSGQVGVVYPPGTGLLLAIFPRARRYIGLNRAGHRRVSARLVWADLILAASKQAWLSAGIVILALHLGLEILGRIGSASFSINCNAGAAGFINPLRVSGVEFSARHSPRSIAG